MLESPLQGMSENDVKRIDLKVFKDMTPDQVASLTLEEQVFLTAEQFTKITKEKLDTVEPSRVWTDLTPRFLSKVSVEKIAESMNHLPHVEILNNEEAETEQSEDVKNAIEVMESKLVKLSKDHIKAIQDVLQDGHLNLLNDAQLSVID